MPKSLLLADDSITIQKVVQITFASEDFQITAVDNGDAALQKIASAKPNIVLADVVMPGKNGYELCQALKADANTKAIPVILLAGTFEPFDADRAKAVGADDYIIKPFESQALIDKVKRLVGGGGPVTSFAPPPTAAKPAASPFAAPPPSAPFAAKPPAAVPPPVAPPAASPKPAAPSPFAGLGTPAAKPAVPVTPAAAPLKDPFGMGSGYAAPKPAATAAPAAAKAAGQSNWDMSSFEEPGRAELPEIEVADVEPLEKPAAKPSASAPMAAVATKVAQAAAANPALEAQLRGPLSDAVRDMIEKIVWEIVPELAETIIREELERLLREK